MKIRKGHTEVQILHTRVKSVYVIIIINTPTNKSSQANKKNKQQMSPTHLKYKTFIHKQNIKDKIVN